MLRIAFHQKKLGRLKERVMSEVALVYSVANEVAVTKEFAVIELSSYSK
jgi:hypothetical protein